jgi:hypothetical protein
MPCGDKYWIIKSWDLLLPFGGVNILTKVNHQPLAHHDGRMIGGQETFSIGL